MELFLVRHAWAGEFGDPRFSSDSERPLTPEGVIRFEKVVSALIDREFAPQVIASSPLVRCRQTAQIIADLVKPEPEVEELHALAPGSNIQQLIRWTREQDVDQVAWVGHNPDMPMMVAELIGNCSATVRFAKGTVAALRFDGPVRAGGAELRWLTTAKMLGC